MKLPAIAVALLCLAACLFSACSRRQQPPYEPQDALATFVIEPGFRIELFAAEPLIQSPAAMEFDEDGRIYVAEATGYPLNTEGQVGAIKLLEDTDGDGRPDRSTVFAGQLVIPTGVMRWKKGILVTDAPHVYYFEDTDGDGRADIRKVVLTGFAVTNPQHVVNSPVYGLDNWVYLANEPFARAVIYPGKFGDEGSDIRFPDRPDLPPLTERGRNVRFRPDTFELEALAGRSQFGHAFDEWGRHLLTHNTNHIRHEAIRARYLKRNPDLLAGSAIEEISDHGAASKVFPITAKPGLELLSDIGQFTSACGITLYLGGAFPPEYHNSVFIAEPAHSLVHRDVMRDAGPTFVAHRGSEGREFLASTDPWFRPVNLYVGPDGALYLLDFYRPHIEHPEWMSSRYHDHQQSPELNRGSDRGRIYRIVPRQNAPERPRGLRMSTATDEDLVQALARPNIWWRRTAQRLLVARRSDASVPLLRGLFENSASPLARLHALWTLEGLGKLPGDLIEQALGDEAAGVRENAIVLAEARLARGDAAAAALAARLAAMASDGAGAGGGAGEPDPKVRYQLLCTLGGVRSEAARRASEKLLFSDPGSRWMQLAALSASSDDALRWFELVRSRAAGANDSPAAPMVQLARHAAAIVGARARPGEVRRVLAAVAANGRHDRAAWRAASLEGLAAGLDAKGRRATAPADRDAYARQAAGLFASRAPEIRRGALRLLDVTGLPSGAGPLLARAVRVAAEVKADPEERADAVTLLALESRGEHANGKHVELLRALVEPRQPEAVRVAAVRALGRIKGAETAAFLLERWRSLPPAARSDALDALLAEPARVRLLVHALASGDVQTWVLAHRHRARLTMQPDAELRAAARKVLEQPPAEREQVVKRYEPALSAPGDPGRGRVVFDNACAKCHRLEGRGHDVGPDLASVLHNAKDELLRNILMPNRSIAQNYESYVVETASGRILDGVLGPQTPTAITLRQEEGKEEVIPRAEIRDMRISNLSAMPEDLEKQISIEQMADLLTYLKAVKSDK